MATSIKLDDDLKSRIHHLADRQRRSAHWIMREAIRDYVEREEKHENFKQEALGSWAIYQKTGRHLSGDEVRVWLQTWVPIRNRDTPVPQIIITEGAAQGFGALSAFFGRKN
ncbi:putative transcriptional regulator, partial [Candidatus Regiella insecticola 5.15]